MYDSVVPTDAGRWQSIPGPRSGHWKHALSPSIFHRVVGRSSVDVGPEQRWQWCNSQTV